MLCSSSNVFVASFCVFFLVVLECDADVHVFNYVHLSSCNENQFYDTISLSCRPCGTNLNGDNTQVASSDGLSCVCRSGHRLTNRSSSLGGIICIPCADDEVVSSDGMNCVPCTSPLSLSNISDNSSTSLCKPCTNGQISVDRNVDGTLLQMQKCVDCKPGTQRNVLRDKCIPCLNPLLARKSLNCNCPSDTMEMVGGVCFEKTELKDISDVSSLYLVNYEHQELESAYFCRNIRAAFVLCQVYRNASACQLLSNLCTLLLYRQSLQTQNACSRYLSLVTPSGSSVQQQPSISGRFPPLFYLTDSVEDTMKKKDVDATYSLKKGSINNRLNFTAVKYSLDGKFLGMNPVSGATWQLCTGPFRVLDSALRFGTRYSRTCRIPIRELFLNHETMFYDPYLYYEVPGKLPVLYAVPVLIRNYASNRGSPSQWKFVRRFFLVDNVSGRSPCHEPGVLPAVVRYAKDITIRVEMYRAWNEASHIYPPIIIIDYAEATLEDFNLDKEATVSFSVLYEMDQEKEEKDFSIAMGVLSSLAVVYSAIQAWSWSKRSGRITIDLYALLKLLLFTCGNLAYIFLTVTFFTCFYILVFFKKQDVVYVVLPTPDQEITFVVFIIIAFVLKAIHLLHVLSSQVFADVFFVDWERPQPKRIISYPSSNSGKNSGSDESVSIWRTYLVANEWAELQTTRKTSLGLQLFATVFFLSVVGFENLANSDPSSSLSVSQYEYQSPISVTCRMALAMAVYMCVAFIQWVFVSFIYESLVEDKIQQFVDLCSISNVIMSSTIISVFLMTHHQYGHYIHGRSVHGHADTDMKSMHEQLRREEDNLCSQRGLMANTDHQTFHIALPAKLRAYYDHVMAPLIRNNRLPGRFGANLTGTNIPSSIDCSIQAYQTMNKFLSSFLEHALRDLDYVVKDRLFVENMLDIEFQDPSDKGYFYIDNGRSYNSALLRGHEMTLIIFDLLLFVCIDLAAHNFVLAAIITFIVGKAITIVYHVMSRRNLACKTLVDSRFLI